MSTPTYSVFAWGTVPTGTGIDITTNTGYMNALPAAGDTGHYEVNISKTGSDNNGIDGGFWGINAALMNAGNPDPRALLQGPFGSTTSVVTTVTARSAILFIGSRPDTTGVTSYVFTDADSNVIQCSPVFPSVSPPAVIGTWSLACGASMDFGNSAGDAATTAVWVQIVFSANVIFRIAGSDDVVGDTAAIQALAFNQTTVPPGACFSGTTLILQPDGSRVPVRDLCSGSPVVVITSDGQQHAVAADVFTRQDARTFACAFYDVNGDGTAMVTKDHTVLLAATHRLAEGLVTNPVCEVVAVEGYVSVLPADVPGLKCVHVFGDAMYHIILPAPFTDAALVLGAKESGLSVLGEGYRSAAAVLIEQGWVQM